MIIPLMDTCIMLYVFLCYLIFMFFILMIIVRLFSYMSSHRSEEYSIYHKLGVEPFVFLLMYYAPVILLAVFGELAGLCIYAASRTLKAYINMSHHLSSCPEVRNNELRLPGL